MHPAASLRLSSPWILGFLFYWCVKITYPSFEYCTYPRLEVVWYSFYFVGSILLFTQRASGSYRQRMCPALPQSVERLLHPYIITTSFYLKLLYILLYACNVLHPQDKVSLFFLILFYLNTLSSIMFVTNWLCLSSWIITQLFIALIIFLLNY